MTSNKRIMSFLEKIFPLDKNTPDKPVREIVLDGQQINHITEDIKKYLENFKDLEELSLTLCNLIILKEKNYQIYANIKIYQN